MSHHFSNSNDCIIDTPPGSGVQNSGTRIGSFMPIYRAPLDDYRFVLNEFLEIDKQRDLPQFGDLTPDLVEDILTNAGKFCEEVLHPINQSGDEEGAHYENGVVRTPKGFKEAYKAYSEAGWGALGAPEALGGAGLPMTISMAVAEMAMSANQSFAMYPGLTGAAYSALAATGAPWMREHIAKKMISGELTGTKIFISGGDHDLTDNIIHMVIAKIPDENGQIQDDLSTVNFFMVPKFLVSEDGTMGARNGVTTGGIEKKMGIKAQATCVLNFDNAVAWRLGPKPQPAKPGEKRSASAGMAGMFAMMNGARLGVGIQGIAIGEIAYQNGYQYVHERRVGHALTGPAEPDKPADLEIVHPDVKRMLLHARSFVEGARAFAMWTTLNMAIARSSRPEADAAGLLSDLMTPVLKAFCTDMGFEAANLAMQCYGGHGYIRDNGVEQFVRDGRINLIYEGANGVQAMDLVGRKLGRKGGAAPMALFGQISAWLSENEKDDAMAPFVKGVKRGLENLQNATLWLAANGLKNPNNAGAGASDYLRLMGIVVVGWMWGRMAKIALTKLATNPSNAQFYKEKLMCARYWMERLVPETPMLLERIQSGSETVMAFN